MTGTEKKKQDKENTVITYTHTKIREETKAERILRKCMVLCDGVERVNVTREGRDEKGKKGKK